MLISAVGLAPQWDESGPREKLGSADREVILGQAESLSQPNEPEEPVGDCVWQRSRLIVIEPRLAANCSVKSNQIVIVCVNIGPDRGGFTVMENQVRLLIVGSETVWSKPGVGGKEGSPAATLYEQTVAVHGFLRV